MNKSFWISWKGSSKTPLHFFTDTKGIQWADTDTTHCSDMAHLTLQWVDETNLRLVATALLDAVLRTEAGLCRYYVCPGTTFVE